MNIADEQKNAWCAKQMGYISFDEAHPDYSTKNSHHQGFWWWNDNQESVVSVENFTPLTNIEQAIEVLREWCKKNRADWSIYGHWVHVKDKLEYFEHIKLERYPDIDLAFRMTGKSLPACANKIVTTLMEVDGA